MQFSDKRRKFLSDSARTVGGVGLTALMLGLYTRESRALPAEAIRPPGAMEEDMFLGACIRCGLCVRDCPYDTLKLAKPGENVALGTPYFTARDIPCEMCEDIPCVKVCPTGALDHSLENIDDARMGLAVVIDQEACIAFQGLRCEVCFNICPVRGKAIDVETRHNERSGKHALFIPVVHSAACTGCGKCEQACILEKSAIKVMPMNLAKGRMQDTYRLGWEERQKSGGALIGIDDKHRYNLPEGMRYDYEGKGLIREESKAVPFSDNPLDALNGKRGGL